MTDIGLTGTVTINEAPALASLANVDAAAEETTTAINSLGAEGDAAVGRLIASFGGLADSADAAAMKISASQSKIITSMGGVAASTGKVAAINQTLGATAAIIAVAAGGAMALASNFDLMLAHTAANAGMSNQELMQMRETVLSLGKETGQTFEGLANGFMHIHNLGFEGAAAVTVLTEANKAAIATGSDVAGTAEILAKTMHEYSLGAGEASKAMNVLLLASQDGNMTLGQFDAAMGSVLGSANNLGVKLTDVSAAESALTKHGFDAAEAATQLKSIMEHMTQPTSQTEEALKALSQASGVNLVEDFSKAGLQAKGLSGVMGDLRKALGLTRSDTEVLANAQKSGLLASMAQLNPASKEYAADLETLNSSMGGHLEKVMKLIPAMRGGLGAMVLLGSGAVDYAGELEKLNEAYAGHLNPTQEAFNRTMQESGQQFQVLKQQIESELIPAGEKLMPVVHDLIPAFRGVADMVVDVLDGLSKLPRPVQEAVIGIGALSAANVVLGGALGATGMGVINLIRTLPMFTTATGAATVATDGEAASAGLASIALGKLSSAYAFATTSTVGFTAAGGADITMLGVLTAAGAGVTAFFSGLPLLIGGAVDATYAFGVAIGTVLGPLALLIGGAAMVGTLGTGIADQQIKQSDEAMRGLDTPEVSPFLTKEAELRSDEKAHPSNRSKDEKQLGEIKEILQKILGTHKMAPTGHKGNEHSYLHQQNNEHDSLTDQHKHHDKEITTDEAPGKDKKDKSETEAADALAAAREKLAKLTMTQTQLDTLEAAGSEKVLNGLNTVQRAILQSVVIKTEAVQKEQAEAAILAAARADMAKMSDTQYHIDMRAAAGSEHALNTMTEANRKALGVTVKAIEAKEAAQEKAKKIDEDAKEATRQLADEEKQAAKETQDSWDHALSDVSKQQSDWAAQMSELSAKLAGTYTTSQGAFDSWAKSQESTISELMMMSPALAAAFVAMGQANTEWISTATKAADGAANYAKQLAEVNHQAAILAAKDPRAKFGLTQQIYDADSGSYVNPSGVTPAQTNQLYNAKQSLSKSTQVNSDIQDVGDKMKSIFQSSFEASYTKGSQGFIQNLRKGMLQTAEEFAAKMASEEMLKGLMAGLGGFSGHKSTSSGGGIQSAVNAVIPKAAIPGMNAAGTIASIFGFPGFASGGEYDGSSPFIAGEHGPEIIHPSRGGRVLSHDDTMAAVSGKGRGGDTHQHFNTSITVNAPDPSAYKQSAHQIAAEQSRALARHKR